MKILLSQVAGEGRWTQFNVPLSYVTDFFRVPGFQNAELTFGHNDAGGQPTETQSVSAIYKEASSNWAFEIPGAAGLDFDAENRPILAVSDEHYPVFVFDLIMPTEARYEAIAVYLNNNRQTPVGQLARLIATGDGIVKLREMSLEV